MKKLTLKLVSIKQMLSKEEMKKINGGYSTYYCCQNNDSYSSYSDAVASCPGGGGSVYDDPFSKPSSC